MMQTISETNILRLASVKIKFHNLYLNPNPQPTVPETNAFLNVLEMLEINASQEVIPHRIDLDVTVGKDPITRGEYQAVMVIASNSTTGKELESFYRARN
jgi:hypothetical protein